MTPQTETAVAGTTAIPRTHSVNTPVDGVDCITTSVFAGTGTPLTIPDITEGMDACAAALKYAAAGWYCIPVERGTKSPGSVFGKRWQEMSTRDPKTITALWAGTSHGIALHVGRSGALVLDVDAPDKLPDVIADNITDDVPFQLTRPATDGRGHLVFTMPPGKRFGNSNGKLGIGWGEVRGANGVIMVSPSHHPDGGEYAWQRTGLVPVLPAPIADLLPEAGQADTDAATDVQVSAFMAAHSTATNTNLLGSLVNQFREKVANGGSRHQAGISVMAWAMDEAAAGVYAATEADKVLRKLFIASKTDPTHPGKTLGRREAAHAWDGIRAWAIGRALAKTADKVSQRADRAAEQPTLEQLAGIGQRASTPTPLCVVESVESVESVDTPRSLIVLNEGGFPRFPHAVESQAPVTGGLTSDSNTFHTVDTAAVESPAAPAYSTVADEPDDDPLADMRNGEWLDGQEFADVEYVIDGLISEGLGFIVGPPKAGKSFLVAAIALAVAAGGHAFGCLKVKQRPVLYLALEDGHARLQRRFRAILGHENGKRVLIPAGLHVITKANHATAPAMIAAFLQRYANQKPLVIVDTLGKIKPPKRASEDSYQADYQFCTTLKDMADAVPGSAVLAVHHNRKAQSDDFVDSVSGTHGITGAADLVAVLTRKRKSAEAVLSITGREVEENAYAFIAESRPDCIFWRLEGGTLERAAGRVEERREDDAVTGLGALMGACLKQVNIAPGPVDAVTVAMGLPGDVKKLHDVDTKMVSTYLGRLVDGGFIARVSRGMYQKNDASPPCEVCGKPMVAGQVGTHFECRDAA